MSNVNTYLPKNYEFMPSKQSYLFRAGFKSKKIILDDTMRKLTNTIYVQGLELVCPKIIYVTLPIEEVPSQLISHIFKDVKLIILFASTLGNSIDRKVEEYIKEDKTLDAYLLDAWASEAVEKLNHTFYQALKEHYSKVTRRVSPGYEEIDLRTNFLVLDILQTQLVKANPETGILLPRKSTICLVGAN